MIGIFDPGVLNVVVFVARVLGALALSTSFGLFLDVLRNQDESKEEGKEARLAGPLALLAVGTLLWGA